MSDSSQLRDRIRDVLEEDLTDDYLAPIFAQVVGEFVKVYPESESIARALESRTAQHGQYKLALESLLQVLNATTGSEDLVQKYKEQTAKLQSRVDEFRNSIAARLRK